jgi:hypothetical protein
MRDYAQKVVTDARRLPQPVSLCGWTSVARHKRAPVRVPARRGREVDMASKKRQKTKTTVEIGFPRFDVTVGPNGIGLGVRTFHACGGYTEGFSVSWMQPGEAVALRDGLTEALELVPASAEPVF